MFKPILALLAAITVIPSGEYDLVWHPAEKQKLRYSVDFKGQFGDHKFKFSSNVLLHVKKVQANGDYSLGTSFRDTVTEFDGQAAKVPDSAEDVQEYDRGGKLKNESQDDEADPVSEILAQLGELKPPKEPVKIGSTWTNSFPAKPNGGFPAAEIEYKLTDVRATDKRIRIEFKYHQEGTTEPTTANGIVYVSGGDQSLISIQSKIEHFKLHPELPAGTATLELKLKDG